MSLRATLNRTTVRIVLVVAMVGTSLLPISTGDADAAMSPTSQTVTGVRQVPPADQIPTILDEAVSRGRLSQRLRDATIPGGTARVIVEVRLPSPFRAEGDLATPPAIRAQRAAIAQSQSTVRAQLQAAYATGIKELTTIPYLALETDAAGLAILTQSPDVVRIGQDEPIPLTAPAADPRRDDPPDKQHAPVGPSLAESEPLIGATVVWAAGVTGAGQAVAVLDTGVDRNHSFLAGKVISEACYSTTSAGNSTTTVCPGGADSESPGSGGPCLLSISGCDHGTHVAGIAAGNGATFSGVARGGSIVAIQVFSRKESTAASPCSGGAAACAVSFNSDQILGLERVLALRFTFSIASVNMSLGGGQFFSQAACDASVSNQAVKAAIDNLRGANIATVIASGNEGFTDSMAAPGCISSAISVGSTTKADAVSSFSNSATFLDLLAPGSSISSSVPNNAFGIKSGTSMATPHVAGAFALLKSKAPNATIVQIEEALKNSGKPILDGRNGITKPRIQLDAAANLLPGGTVGLPNDAFASPVAVPQLGTVLTAVTTTASTEVNEPVTTSGCGSASSLGKTVWYTLSVPHQSSVRIHTEGSDFDTVIAVYVGNSLTGLTRVACDDDSGTGTASRLELTATPGTTYRIQVGGFAGDSGSLSLTVDGSILACQSRPNVQVSTLQTNPGELKVVVQAGVGGITMLRLGRPNRPLVNASVRIEGGPSGIGSSQDVPLPSGPTSITMFVTRTSNVGTPVTVPFAVEDACGSWDSTVGLGTGTP